MKQDETKTAGSTTKGPLDPPVDGDRKTDRGGSWIGCCGIWWSRDAWLPPSAAIETDATAAAAIYRVLPAESKQSVDAENCPRCGKSFHRNDPDRVDAARVLGDGEATPLDESAYRERLRDTTEGDWIRFGPQIVLPQKSARLVLENTLETMSVGHLSLPSGIAHCLRVVNLVIGCDSPFDGPLPGEIFAVRIPKDARHPIDRGGSLGRRYFLYPGIASSIALENKSSAPIEAFGAVFGQALTNEDFNTLSRPHRVGKASS